MQLFVGEPYFLVTGHAVDLRVVDYIKSIELAGKFYAQIETRLEQGQLIMFLVCGAIAFLMLLAAVWLAIQFATRLTEPIGGLMAAAEQMRGGDLSVARRRRGRRTTSSASSRARSTAWPARSSSSAAS